MKLLDRAVRLTGRIPGYIVGLATLGIGADIVSRETGLGPIGWMLESVEYLLYVLTFVGVPYVMLRGGHVTVDIVVNSLPPRPRSLLIAAGAALMCAISAILVWVTTAATIVAFEDESTIYKAFAVKEWVLLSLLPVSFAALTFACGRLFWRTVRSPAEASADRESAPL